MASSGICSTCKGTGARTGRVGTTSKCAVCNGTGVCKVCQGTGMHRDKDCPFCLHAAPEKPTLAETQGKKE
ncbi:MAG: hypothetical protein HYS70_04815 [Nitrospinae bacterium]|nr:hypothetical protein [Nitrospinota bacterium]